MRIQARTARGPMARVRRAVFALFLIASLILPASAFAQEAAPTGPAAPDALGSVTNMTPAGGVETTIASGDPFTVTVEVYKAERTPGEGESYEAACFLHWGKVSAFGQPWTNVTDTPMPYIRDSDDLERDVFAATISPLSGRYEFTVFCDDVAEGGTTWADNPGGNGRLTVTAPTGGSCNGAATNNDVWWSALLHDSFAPDYRAPFGAVTNAQGVVTLRVRACRGDLTAAQLRVWDDRTDTESLYDMTVGPELVDPIYGEVTLWTYDLPIPADPTILYYTFRLTDGTDTDYYRDDDPKFYGGGLGVPTDSQSEAELNSYQLTVYDQNFTTPDWMQNGIVYQVFPDRFRDGNTANNAVQPRFYYNQPGGTIWRSYTTVWNTLICDPRAGGACANKFGDNLYGGDLAGITQKINDGYFSNLGVSVIYLTPIFQAPSNHKYDTMNFRTVDSDFGGATAFQNLMAAAASKRISIVLDGVFNHTSSDSAYFDRYSRWNSLDRIDPRAQNGPGLDDNISACESPNSVRRAWYLIPDAGSPATGETDRCDPVDTDDRLGAWTQTYTAWYGYGSLPKLNSANQGVRNLVYAGGIGGGGVQPSIAPYWVQEGASGWRLDVGGDIDPGLTNDPANDYWEGFRAAVKDTAVQTRTVPLIVGEEWGDASPWLLGNEWDSAMNYRLRSAALSWLFTGCSGDGCTGGASFEDNDSNPASSSGEISALTPSQFNARLRSIHEDYPPMAFKAMMNIGGSHDTNRLRFLLKKINNDDDAAALKRLQEYWLFNMTYAGAPTIYYGDEMAVQADGVWAGGKWEDDPYNRLPFPWDDTPGAYAADTGALPFLRSLTSARHGYSALQSGDTQHGLVIDDANKVYAFARTLEAEQKSAIIALNRDVAPHAVTFTDLEAAPYLSFQDEIWMDVVSGSTYTVQCDPDTFLACQLTVEVPAESGVLLVVPGKADQPEPPLLFATITNTVDLNLNWAASLRDTNELYEFPDRYELWRSESPYGVTGPYGDMTLVTVTKPADFGGERHQYIDPNAVGDPLVNHFYKVVAVNGAGGRSLDTREEAEFDFSLVPGTE
ncbi:MAG: glycoside hydrolase family 13 protein [Anaerolineae bacterium]|nr:glycoside hydrolase family 13 protein [Anaerolineae bacterium]